MPQPAFRFQPLLNLREQRRDTIRGALAELNRRMAEVDAQRMALIEEQVNQQDELRAFSTSAVYPVERAAARRYHLGQLSRQMATLDQQRQQLADSTQKVLELLVSADQDVKVLEKLSEKQAEELRRKLLNREERERDDIWLANHIQEFRR